MGFDVQNKEKIIGLHVTSLESLDSILVTGLEPRLGPLSVLTEKGKATYFFHAWEDMEDAEWLFDMWPYESEPILLAVDLSDLDQSVMRIDAPYELVVTESILPEKITVLVQSEHGWPEKLEDFLAMGGRKAHCPELVERLKAPINSDEFADEQAPAP